MVQAKVQSAPLSQVLSAPLHDHPYIHTHISASPLLYTTTHVHTNESHPPRTRSYQADLGTRTRGREQHSYGNVQDSPDLGVCPLTSLLSLSLSHLFLSHISSSSFFSS